MRLVAVKQSRMKIAWLLVVWTWVSSSGDVVAQLRFKTDESLDEILEDETHKLKAVLLKTSPADGGAAMWSQAYFQLLISCDHGTLRLDREVEMRLVDTTFLCVSHDDDPREGRSLGVFTTAQEAQQILSSIIYRPDVNYHSTWYGVTDPLCLTGNDDNEIVRMQLSPVNGEVPQPSQDVCVAVDPGENSAFASETGSIHEKKISVASVNDPPTVERESGQTLSVDSGGSCIGLSGFRLGDVEAMAVESDSKAVIPIFTLQLNVKVGTLRINRRSALQNGIHAVGNGKNTGDATLAWKLADLFDSLLMMKGTISDLNEFLPEVEYCSSPDHSVVVPETLRVTLSDNGFCGNFTTENLSASLGVPVHILSAPDLRELLVMKTNVTLTKDLAQVAMQYTPGTADKIAVDTISMFLEPVDSASGTMNARMSRMKTKLGIRLPASYLQVDLGQTLTIEGIDFEGYAQKLNFTVSCRKGTISLLGKQPAQSLSRPHSTLKINGYFSTLREAFRHSYLIYSPQADSDGYDKLAFLIESVDDHASEILPIVINAPMKPPALALPVTPIYVFESDYISIVGVTLNIAESEEQSGLSRGISVDISTQSGKVELTTVDRNQNHQHNAGIQIQGDAENINAALKGLRYRSPVRDAAAEDQILFSIYWTGESERQISPGTFTGTIHIKITRRPLTLNVLIDGSMIGDSSLLSTAMGTPASLESLLIQVNGGDDHWGHCNEGATTVNGVKGDACNVTIDLSLLAGHGLVFNSSKPFSQGRAIDLPLSLAHFTGSVKQANRFLRQQVYVPDTKFYGPDQVMINIKHATSAIDEKETMVEDTVLLPVYVAPDCEEPQLSWADSGTNMMSFSSSTRAPFTLPEILLARGGLEKGYCQDDIVFRVTVRTDQGFLTLKSTPATITRLNNHHTLVLEGRIWSLNLALKSVEYQYEIRSDMQIPVTASIEVRVQGETSQDNDLSAVVSSALLRLKFVGDTRLPDILSRKALVCSEDTDMLIGGEINLDALVNLTDESTVNISVHNGIVYAAADGVHMNASSEQQVSTNDRRHLRSVMSNLHYISNPNFNGIDEINFRMPNQESTLYIYVQPENDPPEFTFNSDEIKDWYKYPRMFIPSFHLSDPDKNQMFKVDIRADNGSLFLEQTSSSAFDGVTVERNSSPSSLRMISNLSRLNTIFLQRLVEFVPKASVNGGVTRISCAASIELCGDDGSISVCKVLRLPEQDPFYHVTVSNWARSLNLSAGSSLNISGAFEIHQKFDVMYELFLRVHASSGFVHSDVPRCGEVRDGVDAYQPQRSERILTIRAPDAVCLNKALGSLQLQSVYSVNDSIQVQLELFSEEMRLLANESFSVKVTDKRLPKRISAVRMTNDEPWIFKRGSYANLASLLNVSIVTNPDSNRETKGDDDILELNVSCLNCLWRYGVHVPSVSYEFAQIPSSQLKFLGLSNSLSTVLASLELTITSNSSSGAEAILFQLAPAARSMRGMEPIWRDRTNISIPFTTQSSSLVWGAQQTSYILQSPNYTADLSGVELTGTEKSPSYNLTIQLECTLGKAAVSMAKVKPTYLNIPCGADEPTLSFTVERSRVNEVMRSMVVKVIPVPNARETRVELRLSAVEAVQGTFSGAVPIELHFRSSLQSAETILTPRNSSITIQMDEHKVRTIGDIFVVSGDLENPAWFRMEARVAHGRLSIPTNVCCVDIRKSKHENELDVVGPVLALKNALAGAHFQGNEYFSGKDFLEVAIAQLSSQSRQPYASFRIPIHIIAVNHAPTITHYHHGEPSSGSSLSNERIVLNDVDLARLDSPAPLPTALFLVSLSSVSGTFLLDDSAKHRVSVIEYRASASGFSNFTFEALLPDANAILGRVLYVTSTPDLKCAENNEIFVSVNDQGHGIETWMPKQAFTTLVISTCEKDPQLPNVELAVEPAVYDSTASAMNATEHLLIDPARQFVGSTNLPPPGILHERMILVDQTYEVPVPRVISKASLYYSNEDAAFQFSDLALQFADNKTTGSIKVVDYAKADPESSPLYKLKVRVNHGVISNIDEQQARQNPTSLLEMEGTAINLERGLNRLVYFSPQNWNEEQFPGGHIVEWQFVVSYENKSVETFVDLVVTSRVDAPAISVPYALEDPSHYMGDYLSVLRLECLPLVCDEDTPLLLDGFSVRAADTTQRQLSITDLLLISISVYHGVISLGYTLQTNCISQFVGIQSWKRVSFKASVDCMNRVLAAMTYVGDPNFSGADQLKIRVEYARELDAAFDEVTVPIIVVELNDAPYIDVKSVFYEADEDIPLVIDDLHLRDPDTLDESLRIIMETKYGQLALLRPHGVTLITETVESTGEEASRLTLEGTLHNLNVAIASVVYSSAKNWNSLQFRPDDGVPGMNGFDTITIHSTDFSIFNGSSVSVLFVYVGPEPDPVTIYIPSNALVSSYADDPPGMLRGDEDTWIGVCDLSFSSADDTARATLVVSLSVTNGIISLLHVRGLTFLEGTADDSNIVKLKGTFENVNACMVGLRYLPNKDFYGRDSFIVTANAVDEYTQEQTPSSSIRVAITIDAVNDAPVWNIGSSIVRELQQGRAASIAKISFHDVDVAAINCAVESCMMDLIVEASGGFVTLSNQTSPLFSNDMVTKKVAYLAVSGTPDELNVMLSEITFDLSNPEYYRADSPGRTDIKLQLTIDDRGTFGWGGPQISTTTVVFNPVVWSRYAYSILAPEDVLTLDENTEFVFAGDLQLADSDSARLFHNILELTITCTNGAFALSSRVTGVQVLRNNSDGGIVIRGFIAQLNTALNGSSYIPAANWDGSEELSLSVVELNHREKSKESAVSSVFLFVAPRDERHQHGTR